MSSTVYSGALDESGEQIFNLFASGDKFIGAPVLEESGEGIASLFASGSQISNSTLESSTENAPLGGLFESTEAASNKPLNESIDLGGLFD